MNETMMKLKILGHAELTLAKVNSRRVANRAVLVAITIGLILLAVVMVNVGSYELLTASYGPATGAYLVAAGNGVLALIPIAVSRSLKPGPEEHMVREIREMALAELSADAQGVQESFASLSNDVKRIQSGFTAISSGGLGAGLGGLGPVLGLVIDMLKRRQ